MSGPFPPVRFKSVPESVRDCGFLWGVREFAVFSNRAIRAQCRAVIMLGAPPSAVEDTAANREKCGGIAILIYFQYYSARKYGVH